MRAEEGDVGQVCWGAVELRDETEILLSVQQEKENRRCHCSWFTKRLEIYGSLTVAMNECQVKFYQSLVGHRYRSELHVIEMSLLHHLSQPRDAQVAYNVPQQPKGTAIMHGWQYERW